MSQSPIVDLAAVDPRQANEAGYRRGIEDGVVHLLDARWMENLALEVMLLRCAVKELSATVERRDRTIQAYRTLLELTT